MEQMYDIVSKVEHYHEFVPWCKESVIVGKRRSEGSFNCKLTVGFPPVVERYTSKVTVSHPTLVKVSLLHLISSIVSFLDNHLKLIHFQMKISLPDVK